jgi:hypothetical protein
VRGFNPLLAAKHPLRIRLKSGVQSAAFNSQEFSMPQFSRPRKTVFVWTVISLLMAGLATAVLTPNFLRSRKRTRATRTLEDLRLIDAAIDQYAIDNNKAGDSGVPGNDDESLDEIPEG